MKTRPPRYYFYSWLPRIIKKEVTLPHPYILIDQYFSQECMQGNYSNLSSISDVLLITSIKTEICLDKLGKAFDMWYVLKFSSQKVMKRIFI